MSDIHFRNLIDPPAVERLAGVVDPEIAARQSLANTLIAASDEIYKRTRRQQERDFDEMFIVSATTKESLKKITDVLGVEPE